MLVTYCLINTSVTNTAFVQMLKNIWIQLGLEEETLAGPMWVRFRTIFKKAFLQMSSLLSTKLVVSDFLRSGLIISISIVSLTSYSSALIGGYPSHCLHSSHRFQVFLERLKMLLIVPRYLKNIWQKARSDSLNVLGTRAFSNSYFGFNLSMIISFELIYVFYWWNSLIV